MDKSRQSPLHVAASEDKSSILEVLLQNNANADLVDVNLNNGTIIVFFFPVYKLFQFGVQPRLSVIKTEGSLRSY